MRRTAWFERSVSAGFWIASLGCLPQQELSAYSGGAEVSGAPAPGDMPGAELPTPGPLAEAAAGALAEPSDTPADTDGLAQPEQLAPASPETAMAADPPAEEADPAAEAASSPAAQPPVAMPAPPAAPAVEPQPGAAPVAPIAEPAPVSAQFRFVRLVADSEFNGGPLSSAAELDVLGADGQALDRSGWVATADSAEPTFFGGAPALLAIDGQAASVWHTAWFQLAAPPPHPHFLQLDMGQPRSVTGFRYLARQDLSVGRIADYRFFVSEDGVTWGEPILAGRLQDSAQPQDVRVAPP